MADLRKAMLTPVCKGKNFYIKLFTEDQNTAILPIRILSREESHLQQVNKYASSKLFKKNVDTV